MARGYGLKVSDFPKVMNCYCIMQRFKSRKTEVEPRLPFKKVLVVNMTTRNFPILLDFGNCWAHGLIKYSMALWYMIHK